MRVQCLSYAAYDVARENSIDFIEAENDGKDDAKIAGRVDWLM